MIKGTWFTGAMGCAAIGALLAGSLAYAAPATATPEDERRALKESITRQAEELQAQRQALEIQRLRLEELEAQVNAATQPSVQPAVYGVVPRLNGQDSSGILYRAAHKQTGEKPSSTAGARAPEVTQKEEKPQPEETLKEEKPQAEGTKKEEKPRPEIAILTERGGVLTPQGTLVLEPKVQYSKSTTNELTFRGISVVEGFLIGIIEATDADRDTVTASLKARYGITDRLEVEVEVPYVYRSDRTTSTVTGTSGAFSLTDEIDGNDIGDIEVAGHYQINRGRGGWPFFIANLRYKTTTGNGPFDVSRDPATGAPTELATGSGFTSLEPSLTVLFPTDPAVLFANVGYLVNLSDDVDQLIGGRLIGEVDPGDTIRLSFGVGFALNERLSLSLGFQSDFVQATTTEIDGVDVESEVLTVGLFLFGASYKISDSIGVNVTVQVGATEDAPDARLILRVPIRFDLF